jgi:hypothetical protein
MKTKKKRMTIRALVKYLKEIDQNVRGEESWHSDADSLLLEYIDSKAVTAAFDDIPKWYS